MSNILDRWEVDKVEDVSEGRGGGCESVKKGVNKWCEGVRDYIEQLDIY